MRFPSRHPAADGMPGVVGTVRLDRRLGSLLRHLQPGDIAVVEHLDLDRAHAEALVERGVVAVVNASAFISGRYPNLGPQVLAGAGVAMLDSVGPEVFGAVRDGATARVEGDTLVVGDNVVARGHALTGEDVQRLMDEARSGLSSQLQSFTHNTTEFLRREQDLLLRGEGIPDTTTRFEGRPAVVVVHGYDYRDDLRALRGYIREQHPLLVGVDAGADALLEAGHRVDLVVVGAGGLDQPGTAEQGQAVSDRALRAAREVVLHTDRSGRAVGADRLERLGVRTRAFAASGTSEDAALLLADHAGASMLVTVGMHATLDDLLDRQRTGLASVFLTRLRVGTKVVDAKNVPRLYAGRVRPWHLLLVLLAGLVALGVALAATPVGSDWWSSVHRGLSDLVSWIQGLLT